MDDVALPRKITWRIPKAYRNAEHAKVVAEYRPIAWRWIAAAALTALIGVALLYASPAEHIWIRVSCALVTGAMLALLHGFQSYKMADLTRAGCDYALLTTKGPAGTTWRKVKWYQITDVAEQPGLRALEMCFDTRSREVTILLPYDPAELDECQLAAFLDQAAPGKHWQH